MLTATVIRTRAPRFPIQTPIYYRDRSDQDRIEGMTLNISRSGVLFQCATELERRRSLQVRILFPGELTGESPARMICTATVLRKQPELSAVAVSIGNCRFQQACIKAGTVGVRQKALSSDAARVENAAVAEARTFQATYHHLLIAADRRHAGRRVGARIRGLTCEEAA
jgi:hypothetical protein